MFDPYLERSTGHRPLTAGDLGGVALMIRSHPLFSFLIDGNLANFN